jgi:2-polyprenyl-6-methoxyphenol hydroxylase-like FAD-dependent oxidoreductase
MMESLQTRCCIAGGGPAGMMFGFLLARAGVDVLVLEKHPDFLRDFRGDTVHPSTLELMYELGLLEDFLRRHHQRIFELGAQIDQLTAKVVDFTHLPTHCKFTALMPQWDFLNFIAEKAKVYPQFHLRMQAEVIDLIEDAGHIVGVRLKTPEGDLEVRADLVVGADGRHSIVRQKAGLEVIDRGAPIDVLWMRISRAPGDPPQTLGRFHGGNVLVMLNRDNYWQCAFVIAKGAFDDIRANGLEAFRDEIARIAPFLAVRTSEVKSWDDIKLLSVAVDHLREWARPGLLCIGDSAHAMSPIGGVGINLAIQDAVAAANILAPSLERSGPIGLAELRQVQKRREFPTNVVQGFQVFAHKRFVGPALRFKGPVRRLPLPLALLNRFSLLRRLPALFLGVGVRPEHVHTRDVRAGSVNPK